MNELKQLMINEIAGYWSFDSLFKNDANNPCETSYRIHLWNLSPRQFLNRYNQMIVKIDGLD